MEVKICSTCFDNGKFFHPSSKTIIEIFRSPKLVHNKSKAGTSLGFGLQRMAILMMKGKKTKHFHEMHLFENYLKEILTVLLSPYVSKDVRSVYQMVAKFSLLCQL